MSFLFWRIWMIAILIRFGVTARPTVPWHQSNKLHWQPNKRRMAPMSPHTGHASSPRPVTCRLMNSRLVLLMEELLGFQKATSTHSFLLGHTQTMGHVWSAWGPNSEEGQMVAGIEDHRHINMKKERVRAGLTGTLAPVSPRLRRRGRGDSLTPQKHWKWSSGTQLQAWCQ